MKVPNFKDNNVVSIGHNSNRSISQEAYQQLKDKLQSVLGMLTEADKNIEHHTVMTIILLMN